MMLPNTLLEIAHDIARAAHLNRVRETLEKCDLELADEPFVRMASNTSYSRIELLRTSDVLVVLIIWRPGHFSKPHDHGGSQCLFRVLDGIATEQRFTLELDGSVSLAEEDTYLPGAVVQCLGDDIHAMGNRLDQSETLLTLHAYSPCPLMHEYPYRGEAGLS